MDGIAVEIGKRILKIRERLGIPQNELAYRAGLSKTYLGELERGQRDNVSVGKLAQIAHILGISMSELFSDIENEQMIWDKDNHLSDTLWQKNYEDTFYPPAITDCEVTTLLQFLVYLPLLPEQDVLNILSQFNGKFEGCELEILKSLNTCIAKIPQSTAKAYADLQAQRLSRTAYMRRAKQAEPGDYCEEEQLDGSDEYTERIKRTIKFFKYLELANKNSIL